MKLKIPHYILKSIIVGFLILSTFSSNGQNIYKSIKYIKYGSSFGMCEGYCFKEIIIRRKTTTTVNIFQGNEIKGIHPNKTDTLRTSKTRWKTLVKSIDVNSFFKLPKTIGCPDCADGGAEWIEIGFENKSHEVNIEYGSDIKEIRHLLSLIKKQK